jgi:hypothetical protein
MFYGSLISDLRIRDSRSGILNTVNLAGRDNYQFLNNLKDERPANAKIGD